MGKIIFIALLAINVSSISAQAVWGLRAGLSRPTMSTKVTVDGYTANNTLDGGFGLEVGPVLYYTIKDNWYLNTGALLSLKTFGFGDYSNTKYYIDVPLYLGSKIPAGNLSFYGQAGPFVGYMLSETNETASKPLNAGVAAMFGINIQRFKIEVGYQVGLLNLWDSDYDYLLNDVFGITEDYKISARLSSLFLGVSYVF
jgi:hypothetical protein